MPSIVKIKNGQTLADITLQVTGDIERWFEVALLNDASITDDLVPGVSVVCPDVASNKRGIADIIEIESNNPASDDDEEVLGGIGHMQIEFDFIVS